MTTQINSALQDASNGLVWLDDTKDKWGLVKDAVDYPVHVLPAFYPHPIKEEYTLATGITNTGRPKQFCVVAVDLYRTNDYQIISTVSDSYGSLKTSDVYEQLQQELACSEQKHTVQRLYVSANGGTQQLTFKMNEMISMDGIPDDLEMLFRLNTSLDGSKSQSLSMIVHNKEGNTDIHTYGGDYTLSARHTKTIGKRSAYYIPTINKMIENWNDIIIPTMSLMFDCKFNRNMALQLISDICEESKMGEAHMKNVKELYTSIQLKTEARDDSLYRVNMAVNQYLDENMQEMTAAKQRFKDRSVKSIQRHLNRLKKV